MDATPVATRLRRSTPEHDAYTVRVADRRLVALATGHPADARRWIYTTRWLHQALLRSGRLGVGLGVQWTPVRGRGVGPQTPLPATLQLCAGHRCLVFHLAHVDAEAVPAVLYRFLADPRVLFVGYGSSYDRRMLWDHYGLDVASACDLRALTGMGNASVELMAERFLGYRGISKPKDVAMSAWHAPRLSVEQVEYACVDAYLAFRLGLLLCPGGYRPVQRAPAPPRAPPLARRAPMIAHAPPAAPVFVEAHRAPGPVLVLPRAPPPAPRAPVRPRAPPPAPHAPPPAPRALGRPRAPPPAPRALMIPRAPPPAPRALVTPCALSPTRRAAMNPHTPEPHQALALMAVAVETAESSSKVAALPGFTGSDTDTEAEAEAEAEAERGGLHLVRWNYASDDDDDDLSSDGYEVVGRGAVTEDEEEEDVYDYVARTGLLSDGDYVVGPGIQRDEEEEHGYEGYVLGTGALNAEDDGEQGYAYKEHAGIGILTFKDHIEEGYKEYTGILTVVNEAAAYEDEVFVGNGHATVVEVDGSGLQLDVYQEPPECYDNSIEAFQGDDDGYGQDDGGDWCAQGDDDGYVQADDSYDAFY